MNLSNTNGSLRKTAFRQPGEPSTIAVRYIIDRFGVSPSLAKTIAALAFGGGR